jgi:hypothetical protein
MNCQDRQQQIALLSYDELSGPERAGLEDHIRECAVCAAVLAEQRELDRMLSEDAELDLPAELLVESRRSLTEALAREKRRSWWQLPEFSVVFRPMKLLESAALVAMGLACGVFIAGQRAANTLPPDPSSPTSAIPENATVNLRIVRADPSSGMVEVAGEVVRPYRRQGTIQDGVVRQLVFGALQDVSNPGARLNAVEILTQQPFDDSVKGGLIHALTQDPVPGVRMKAIEALKAFSGDPDVQAALVQALRKDDIPGIRAGAIEALTAKDSRDEEVTRAIEDVAKYDDNAYVRMIATQFKGKGQ